MAMLEGDLRHVAEIWNPKELRSYVFFGSHSCVVFGVQASRLLRHISEHHVIFIHLCLQQR